MFNMIDNNVYEKICNMMFECHNMIISSYKQLNEFYNSCYCSRSIQNDIKDVLEQDIYLSEINLTQMGF